MYRKSWIIPMVVLVLSSILLFSYQKNAYNTTYALSQTKTTFTMTNKSSDFTQVEYTWPNHHITAIRNGTSWKLTAPTLSDADGAYMYDLINAFISPGNIHFVQDQPTDLTEYGINDYSPTIRFQTSSGQAFEFIQGKAANASFYYAYSPLTDTLYSIDKKCFNLLSKDLSHWLSKNYITFDPTCTEQVTLTSNGQTHILLPSRIHNTIQFKSSTLSDKDVSSIINFLQTTKALTFITTNASSQVIQSYGFNEDALHINVTTTEGDVTSLTLSNTFSNGGSCYVLLQPSNTIVTVPNLPFLQK